MRNVEKNDINKYQIKCGNFTFNINTHMQCVNEAAFDQIIANPMIPHFEVNIWIEKKIDTDHLNACMENGINFIPPQIVKLYDILDCNGIPHIPSNKRINRFSDLNGMVYARFPYITDNFYLTYRPRTQEIFIVGDEVTLERIIIDFLSITAQMTPLHGGCVTINNNSFLILGESKSGKSSLILKLMDLGAEYIADDILFIHNNEVIRQGSYMGIRNDFLPQKLKSLYLGKSSEHYSYINIFEMEKALGYRLGKRSTISDIFMIHPMEYSKLATCQLFPMIPHESIWCTDVLDFDFCNIEKNIQESKKFYLNMLKKSHNIKINFNDFDKYSKGLYNRLHDFKSHY